MKIAHFPSNLPGNASEVYPQLVDAIQQTDTLVEGDMDADAALIWSVLWYGKMSANKQVWDHYCAQNKPVIVIEVGGLIRNTTWKLGINGDQQRCRLCCRCLHARRQSKKVWHHTTTMEAGWRVYTNMWTAWTQ